MPVRRRIRTMSMTPLKRALRGLTVAGLGLAYVAAGAQIPPDTPNVRAPSTSVASSPDGAPFGALTLLGVDAVLKRPVGESVAATPTLGHVDLRGQRVCIAEYQLLFEIGGEIDFPAAAIPLLRPRAGPKPPSFVYQTQPDITALQSLTDWAWADLQARLREGGVVLFAAAEIKSVAGAILDASAPARAPGSPVFAVVRSGDGLRRYLVLSPTGMKRAPRRPDGTAIGGSSPVRREAYVAGEVEALSLGVAVNLSGFNSRAAPVASQADSAGLTLVPRMELRSLPDRPLLLAPARQQRVDLDEAVAPVGEYGRIRLAPPGDPSRRKTTGALHAVFDQDGRALARLLLQGVSVANQAIATAMRLAQQIDQPPLKFPSESPGREARPAL